MEVSYFDEGTENSNTPLIKHQIPHYIRVNLESARPFSAIFSTVRKLFANQSLGHQKIYSVFQYMNKVKDIHCTIGVFHEIFP